ncbi:MAG: hypothetical protein ABJQ69_03640 [Ekhidna sp.]
MIHENLWMVLLSIGILSSTLVSCGEQDASQKMEYRYVNNSGASITITARTKDLLKTTNIERGDSLVQVLLFENGSGFSDIYIITADSISITYNSERRTIYTYKDSLASRSPLNFINYEVTSLRGINSFNRFTFTSKDFEEATPIGAE